MTLLEIDTELHVQRVGCVNAKVGFKLDDEGKIIIE